LGAQDGAQLDAAGDDFELADVAGVEPRTVDVDVAAPDVVVGESAVRGKEGTTAGKGGARGVEEAAAVAGEAVGGAMMSWAGAPAISVTPRSWVRVLPRISLRMMRALWFLSRGLAGIQPPSWVWVARAVVLLRMSPSRPTFARDRRPVVG
jgi:hypothetical protein